MVAKKLENTLGVLAPREQASWTQKREEKRETIQVLELLLFFELLDDMLLDVDVDLDDFDVRFGFALVVALFFRFFLATVTNECKMSKHVKQWVKYLLTNIVIFITKIKPCYFLASRSQFSCGFITLTCHT